MVTLVKSEWHSVEKRYSIEIDEDTLNDIYPDSTVDEIEQKLADLISGDLSPETIIEDAYNENISLDFDWMDEDDWWTDRKGGYDVTYEVVNDD
jgi:hypothetical protein